MEKISKHTIQDRIRKWIQELDIPEEAKKDYHFEHVSEEAKDDRFKFCIDGELIYALYYGDKGKFDEIFEETDWDYGYFEGANEIKIHKEDFKMKDKECLRLIKAIESESNLKRGGRFIVLWRGFTCYISYNFLTKRELIYLANMRDRVSFDRKKDD